ncbi:glycerol-3-phosphate responsive antiterminator [Actinomadura logoneensis]|uniref:Glycerol-3-phosphate responsive antiterminator n=1 Tax=Actinomadura logoneensis TaxID=2293572 RepID=A0A372JB10_9ACTN|nr:glycerol-3-phosphate responsive antiterminator [Actinomadura logoneensis]RFU37170.1 glycerol-3-phosphate responsive antiterminator [Actinomadura logoneensis]
MNSSRPSAASAVNQMLPRLAAALHEVPVIGSVVGTPRVRDFAESPAHVCILASVAVGRLGGVLAALRGAGKTVFVNVDSCPGLAQDRGALEFLRDSGAQGAVSTRLSLVEKGHSLDLLTMMKVFVTDRSNLRRSLDAVSRGRPDLVEVMPAPIAARLDPEAKRLLSPYVAAGFVETERDAAAALALGASAVATSDPRLWRLRREQLVGSPGAAGAAGTAPTEKGNA